MSVEEVEREWADKIAREAAETDYRDRKRVWCRGRESGQETEGLTSIR